MDQELRDLVEQMRDLVRVLNDMSKRPGVTAGSNTDRSADNMTRGVDRMVVALAQLAVKLDTTTRTRREEEEAIKKFANAVEKTATNIDNENKERQAATDALEKEIKAREEATRKSKLSKEALDQEDKDRALKKAKDEAAQTNRDVKSKIEESRRSKNSSRELFDSLSSTGGSAEVLKNKFLSLGGDSLAAQSGLQLFSAGLSGTAKSLTTFATGLINGERGAQLSAKALNDFAAPLLDAAKVIGGVLTALSFIPGPIGLMSRGARIAGAALFGVGAAAGSAALKLNELGAKQLDTLMKSFNDLSGAGINLTTGLEGTLGLMHTLNLTTAEAAQLNEIIGKSSKQLAQMGGTAAMGAERFAKVAGGLVKSGLGEEFERMGITQQEQREAALLYMNIQAKTGQLQLKNIQQLTEESGKFVQELDMAAQLTGTTRKQQQEAEIAAMTEPRFRAALIDARQRGDTEYQQQLLIAKRISRMLSTLGDEKSARGALQQAAARGALPTAEARAAESSYRISEILAQPNITDQQILATLTKNGQVQQQQLSAQNALNGNIDALQNDLIGVDEVVLRGTTLIEEAAKAGFKGPEDITKYLEEQEKKRKQPGGDLALMTSAGRAQQAAAMTIEAGISTFNIAADLNHAASKTFADAVTKFGNIVGFKSPEGGVPTYTTPGSAAIPAGMDVTATNKRVEAAKTDLKSLNERIKAQEEKLKLATTDAEKQEAKAEIERLKGELDTANKRANAAELEQIAARNRAKLAAAGAVKPIDTKLLNALTSGGITDRRAQANILAQIQAESGGVARSENLNYTPERLLEKFPKKFRNIQDAQAVVAGGQEAIGERIYGGRMGNMAPGEGYKYRGRGLIQLTGKENYKQIGDLLGIDLVNKPELANDPEIAQKIAVTYLVQRQKTMGLDLSKSSDASRALGFADPTGEESSKRAAMADIIATKIPGAAQGGVFSGPTTGYPAVLHGKEAVIPLKNGAVPVMMPALDELVSSNRAVDAQVQVLRNEMKSIMSELTNAMTSMKESGSQQRMIELLESISRSQQTTATASSRMAQLAAN